MILHKTKIAFENLEAFDGYYKVSFIRKQLIAKHKTCKQEKFVIFFSIKITSYEDLILSKNLFEIVIIKIDKVCQ